MTNQSNEGVSMGKAREIHIKYTGIPTMPHLIDEKPFDGSSLFREVLEPSPELRDDNIESRLNKIFENYELGALKKLLKIDLLFMFDSLTKQLDEVTKVKERYEKALFKISDFDTLDGDKYNSYEQGWNGVAEFAKRSLNEGGDLLDHISTLTKRLDEFKRIYEVQASAIEKHEEQIDTLTKQLDEVTKVKERYEKALKYYEENHHTPFTNSDEANMYLSGDVAREALNGSGE